jgi:hypothetical protein
MKKQLSEMQAARIADNIETVDDLIAALTQYKANLQNVNLILALYMADNMLL